MTEGGETLSKDMVEGILDALTDRQSQLDVQLKGLTLSVPGTPLSLKFSGTVTVSVHMRELTDEEKAAHAAATIAHIHG
jgi:hypothetical protein